MVATRAGTSRTLVALQPIFMGDRIQTGSNGQAQLLFADNTRLVVGAGSSLLIEKYLLQSASASTVSNFSVNALRGSFRFITGDSPKPSYAIKTPTATIGIRGTEFDLAVRPDGQTQFVLLSGQATVCGGGQCVEALSACTMIEVPRGGTPRGGASAASSGAGNGATASSGASSASSASAGPAGGNSNGNGRGNGNGNGGNGMAMGEAIAAEMVAMANGNGNGNGAGNNHN